MVKVVRLGISFCLYPIGVFCLLYKLRIFLFDCANPTFFHFYCCCFCLKSHCVISHYFLFLFILLLLPLLLIWNPFFIFIHVCLVDSHIFSLCNSAGVWVRNRVSQTHPKMRRHFFVNPLRLCHSTFSHMISSRDRVGLVTDSWVALSCMLVLVDSHIFSVSSVQFCLSLS